MKHFCHAKNCDVEVKPEFLMCYTHWRSVSRDLQVKILKAYRVGQCDDKNPSKEWLLAAKEAIEMVSVKEKK